MFYFSSSRWSRFTKRFFIRGILFIVFATLFSFSTPSVYAKSFTSAQKEELAALTMQLQTIQELFNSLKGSFSPAIAMAQTPPTTTVTFDNPAPPGVPFDFLNGVFNGINFGTSQWRWEGAYGVNPTNHIFFSSSIQSRLFTFSPAPKILASMRVFSGQNGTLTLTDNNSQTKTQVITTGSLQTVITGWLQPSTSVTVTFTAGWDLGVDDIAYSDASAPDTTPPSAPTNLAATVIFSTQINLSWTASTDNVGVTGYRVERCLGVGCTTFVQIATPTVTSYSDSALTANTTYRYQVRASDGAGNLSTYSSIVDATTQSAPPVDTTPPTVSLTAPPPSTMVSGTITVSASASDNVGVSGVQFLLDGANLGAEDTVIPYSTQWNTTTVLNGSYALSARARDAAGNTSTSVAVNVTVANGTSTDYALRFNGNGIAAPDLDRVKIQIGDTDTNPATAPPGPPADIGAADFTFEFWMKAQAAQNTAVAVACGANINWIYGNILIDRDRFNQDRKFGFSLAGGIPVFGVTGPGQGGSGGLTICGTGSVLDNQWHHIALERRSSDGWMWLFVDGVLGAQADGPDGDISYPDNGVPGNFCNPGGTSPCTNSDPYIVIAAEKHDAGSAYPSYSGWFDEMRISNSLRYSSNFVRPTAPFTPDASTAALYHFNEGSGDVITDTSGASGGPSNGVRRFGGSPAGPSWVVSDVSYGGSSDVTPPTVSLTAPVANATVSTTITVSANASDNVGVSGVQFLLDGTNLGIEDTTSPYSIQWNTTTSVNGSHTLTARARDAAGNTTVSTPISVTVSNTAPPSNLIASYSFNEGTGTTANDTSGNNQTGTLSNTSWTPSGRYGQALLFNGTNSWVTINDSNLLDLTTGMTIEAWVYPTTALNGWRTVITKEGVSPISAYYLYASSDTNQPANGVTIGGTEYALRAGSTPALNTWTHLTATYDGSMQRLYINGVQAGSQARTGSIQTTANPLRIGGNSLWGEYFTGRIDEVRIYNRALTQPEIQTDMNTGV